MAVLWRETSPMPRDRRGARSDMRMDAQGVPWPDAAVVADPVSITEQYRPSRAVAIGTQASWLSKAIHDLTLMPKPATGRRGS